MRTYGCGECVVRLPNVNVYGYLLYLSRLQRPLVSVSIFIHARCCCCFNAFALLAICVTRGIILFLSYNICNFCTSKPYLSCWLDHQQEEPSSQHPEEMASMYKKSKQEPRHPGSPRIIITGSQTQIDVRSVWHVVYLGGFFTFVINITSEQYFFINIFYWLVC